MAKPGKGHRGSLSRGGAALAVAWIPLAICLSVPSLTQAEIVAPVSQQNLPNVAGKTFTVVTVDFAPGERAGPHRHGQALVFAYVLEGAIRSELEGQLVQTYKAGQSWSEPPGSHHLLTENVSASTPARHLVVFVWPTPALRSKPTTPKRAPKQEAQS